MSALVGMLHLKCDALVLLCMVQVICTWYVLYNLKKKIELKTHYEFIVISGGLGTCNDIVGYQVSAEK